MNKLKKAMIGYVIKTLEKDGFDARDVELQTAVKLVEILYKYKKLDKDADTAVALANITDFIS